MEFRIRDLEFGLWSVDFGISEIGFCGLEFGNWNSEFGIKSQRFVTWKSDIGTRQCATLEVQTVHANCTLYLHAHGVGECHLGSSCGVAQGPVFSVSFGPVFVVCGMLTRAETVAALGRGEEKIAWLRTRLAEAEAETAVLRRVLRRTVGAEWKLEDEDMVVAGGGGRATEGDVVKQAGERDAQVPAEKSKQGGQMVRAKKDQASDDDALSPAVPEGLGGKIGPRPKNESSNEDMRNQAAAGRKGVETETGPVACVAKSEAACSSRTPIWPGRAPPSCTGVVRAVPKRKGAPQVEWPAHWRRVEWEQRAGSRPDDACLGCWWKFQRFPKYRDHDPAPKGTCLKHGPDGPRALPRCT